MRLASHAVFDPSLDMHPAPPHVCPVSGWRRLAIVAGFGLCFAPGVRAQMSGDYGMPRSSFPDDYSGMRFERLPIFFPPNPPPLGQSILRHPPADSRFPAPPELSGYVSDFFYPALGTRLRTKSLNDKLRARLEQY